MSEWSGVPGMGNQQSPIDPNGAGKKKGRTAAGAPQTSSLSTPSTPTATTAQSSASGTGGSSDTGKNSAQAGDLTAAGVQNDKSQHPNVNSPAGQQSWTQDANGNWTMNQGFTPETGFSSANGSLQGQLAHAMGTPLGDGTAARDQAIGAAYGQSVSRLDPQWAQRDQLQASSLANQGLDPNSQAARNSNQQYGQQRNDAYTSAMNSAIGQGTAAQQATFNENLAAHNAPLNDLQKLYGFLPNQGGVGSQSLQAQIAAQQAQLQQQQITADYVGAGAQTVGSIAGAASDARIKRNIQPLGYEAAPGVPMSQFEYEDAPGQSFQGPLAQDVEQVSPQDVTTGQDGVMRVSPKFAPQPVTPDGRPDPEPYADLSDEQIQKLVSLGVIPEKQDELAEQLAQAQALRGTHNAQGHMTGGAAALGGISDIINQVNGASKANAIGAQRAQLRDQETAGRGDYYGMMRQQAQAQALRRRPLGPPLPGDNGDDWAAYGPGDK